MKCCSILFLFHEWVSYHCRPQNALAWYPKYCLDLTHQACVSFEFSEVSSFFWLRVWINWSLVLHCRKILIKLHWTLEREDNFGSYIYFNSCAVSMVGPTSIQLEFSGSSIKATFEVKGSYTTTLKWRSKWEEKRFSSTFGIDEYKLRWLILLRSRFLLKGTQIERTSQSE